MYISMHSYSDHDMPIGLISVAASENHIVSWEAKYISLIDMYGEIRYCVCTYVYVLIKCMYVGSYRSSITSMGTTESSNVIILQLCQQLELCDDKLKAIESSRCITQRWSKTSTRYREVKALVSSEKRTCILLKIKQAARERWFLLTLKAKYAGTAQNRL